MKTIDFKSMIIGFLGCLCIFLMMGQSNKNLGDIVVDSIIVKSSYSDKSIEIRNNSIDFFDSSKGMRGLGEDHPLSINTMGGTGSIDMYYENGNKSFSLYSYEEEINLLLYNKFENPVAHLGMDQFEKNSGHLSIKDSEGISLMDFNRYGNGNLEMFTNNYEPYRRNKHLAIGANEQGKGLIFVYKADGGLSWTNPNKY